MGLGQHCLPKVSNGFNSRTDSNNYLAIRMPCDLKIVHYYHNNSIDFVFEFCYQAVPGPGKYEINSQFDKRPQAVNTEGMEVDHPPFMSQSKVRMNRR